MNELSESGLYGGFELDKEVLNFVDKMGSLSRHHIGEVPSVQMTPEDHHPMDLHHPFVISFLFLSHQ